MGERKEYTYNDARLPEFTKRFRELVENAGGVSNISEITGISRPTITFWYNGQRTPDAASLITLSQTLGVSSDWLLGLADPDNSTADEKISMISEYTGLSNEAIQELHDSLNPSGQGIQSFLRAYKKRRGILLTSARKKWCNYLLTSGNFMALSIGLSTYEAAFAKSRVETWMHEKEGAETGTKNIYINTGPSYNEAKCAAGWRLSEIVHEMTKDVENNLGIDDEAFREACRDLIKDKAEYEDFFKYAESKSSKRQKDNNGRKKKTASGAGDAESGQ